MSRFSRVRKGRKDDEISRLRDENEALKRAAATPAEAAPSEMPAEAVGAPAGEARQKPARLRIRALAFQRFLDEGGNELNRCIRNAGLKAEAFRSQVQASVQGGQGAWGPDITAYEDRMNCSLQSRMLKQREQWLDRCRTEIEEDIEAGEPLPEHQVSQPRGPVPMPPQETWDQVKQWLADPEKSVPFCFPQVLAYVKSLDGNYEQCPPLVKEIANSMEELNRRLAEERDGLWPQP